MYTYIGFNSTSAIGTFSLTFSWDEMGKYDIPADVEFILSAANTDKLYYIGHSMGTTVFWVALNENPYLSEKISLMVALGPVATVKYLKSPIRYLAPMEPLVKVT